MFAILKLVFLICHIQSYKDRDRMHACLVWDRISAVSPITRANLIRSTSTFYPTENCHLKTAVMHEYTW